MQATEMNATSKDAVSKLVKLWENKNAQRALRGAGLSTFALSLAACGGSSSDTVVVTPDPEPTVTPVALVLTTSNDLFDSNDFTTAADTVTGTGATYNGSDVIVDATAGDGDTLTVAVATADDLSTSTVTVSGIENIVFNITSTEDETISITNVVNGTITVNTADILDVFGNDDASHNVVFGDAGDVTIVAGTGILTLTVEEVEGAATQVDAGNATTVELQGTGADAVLDLTVNGDINLATAVATDINITATAASVVTVTTIGALDTIIGDANTTIDIADLSDLDGAVVTGVAGVVGAGAAITEDLTGIAATITFDADSSGTVADGANLVIDGTSGTDLILDTDDGDDTVDSTASITVTVNELDTTANTITLDNNGAGADTITEINLVVAVDQGTNNAFVVHSDSADITLNVSGAADLELTTTNLLGEINASTYTGNLTASAQAGLLTITGGSGDDTITLGGADGEAFDLDGGAGAYDTLVVGATADLSTGTLANFEILDVTGTATFLASQLSGKTYAVADSGELSISSATAPANINLATIDLSGLQFDTTNTVTVTVNVSTIDSTQWLSTQAFNITGSDADDFITGSDNADTINGGAGDDDITGGAGADTLTGGAGSDSFTFVSGDTTEAAMDTVTDYALSAAGAFTDSLVIDSSAEAAGADDSAVTILSVGAAIAAADAVDLSGADADSGLAVGDVLAVVTDGILTLSGAAADVAVIDTLAEWMDAAGLALASYEDTVGTDAGDTAEYAIAFEFGGSTYVVSATDGNGAADLAVDDVIMLSGVTGVDSLDTSAALNAVIIA